MPRRYPLLTALTAATILSTPLAISAQNSDLAAAPHARDGQSLANQPSATQAMFVTVWSDRAGSRWVEEHDAAVAGSVAGAPIPPAATPVAMFAVAMTPADRYDSAALTIPRGATVTWTNKDTDPHTATGDPAKSIPGLRAALPGGAAPWDAGIVAPGQSWSHTFDVPGHYVYFCQFHGPMGMVGTIDVTG